MRIISNIFFQIAIFNASACTDAHITSGKGPRNFQFTSNKQLQKFWHFSWVNAGIDCIDWRLFLSSIPWWRENTAMSLCSFRRWIAIAANLFLVYRIFIHWTGEYKRLVITVQMWFCTQSIILHFASMANYWKKLCRIYVSCCHLPLDFWGNVSWGEAGFWSCTEQLH